MVEAAIRVPLDSAREDAAGLRRLLGVMVASGAAALGYQMVWTQQAALWLGHEGAAVLAVLAAFFGGLALGSAWLGARVDRSEQPARWYAACEAVIAMWGLLLAWALEPASLAISSLLGPAPTASWQALVTFGGTFLLLLPATLAMGATLPAMERVLAQRLAGGAHLAPLYAANTLGGVLGVLGVAFWLIPQWGLTASAGVCAALNVTCALAVLRVRTRPVVPAAPAAPAGQAGWELPVTLAFTGLLGIGYEVVVFRVLSQVAENTVYTFAVLLAVYLVGTAVGAAAWARGSSGWRVPLHERRSALLLALCLSCSLAGGALWLAPWFKAALTLLLGGGLVAALWSEALLAVLAFGLPTVVMGALFSHLCEEAQGRGLRFGTALAVNTAGAALAPLFFGAAVLVALGAQWALAAVVAGYLVLAWAANGQPRLRWIAGASAVTGLAFAPPLAFVDTRPGDRVLSHQEGALGAVSVVEDPAGGRVLRINNRQQEGSNTTALADARQALLPILLHPAPRRALFLGLGTGVTAQAAALDPTLEVLAVELLPEVVVASRYFDDVLAQPGTPRASVQVADARRFVRSSEVQWDVIVSDNFHPARAGSGALYTVEHFQAVRERLAPGGVFCQWLPLHQMDLVTLRSIVRSFLAVNPQGAALLATNSLQTPVLGLWAQKDAAMMDIAMASKRLQTSAMRPAPAAFGLVDEWALLGSFVAGPASLARFSSGAPLNTDDHPLVSYLAPRATYEPEASPTQRLVALLQSLSARDLLPNASQPEQAARLAAYQQARHQFIAAGVGVQALSDPARMLAQVREPLLAVLRVSADFVPAYEPLLRLAVALRPTDPLAAQALLQELVRLAPSRTLAREALHESAPAR